MPKVQNIEPSRSKMTLNYNDWLSLFAIMLSVALRDSKVDH